MKVKRKKLWVHMVVWVAFICYELGFVIITAGVRITLAPLLIFYLLNIGLFYFNAHVLLNFTFFNTSRRYVNSACLILLELLVYVLIKYLLDNLLTGHWPPGRGHLPITDIYVYDNIYRGLSFIGLSIAYFSTLYLFRFREKAHKTETDRLRATARNLELENHVFAVENAYLQNQISPHLLFNTLSFIHNAVYTVSTEAGDGIMRLTDLMHYSLIGTSSPAKVDLSREVEQVENLIALCRMRYPGEFFLQFRRKGRLAGREIIPLVLITLVENMLKHGDIGEKTAPAKVVLELNENQLSFETYNKKRVSSLYPKGGLGLKNIDKRLQNYYKDRYSLLISDSGEFFTVKLSVDL